MDTPSEKLTETTVWRQLEVHARQFDGFHLKRLVLPDEGRFERCSLEAAGLLLDYSRNWLTDQTRTLLVMLAESRGLPWWRDQLFAGEPINHTEGRAAGHPALRVPEGGSFRIGGEDVVPAVHAELARMERFGAQLEEQGRVTDVVNIGIGGSQLGPELCCDALPSAGGLRLHFLASLDPRRSDALLGQLDPERTLFIVASKSFTTEETLANAERARAWVTDALGEDAVAAHFVAVTAAVERAVAWGIPEDAVFAFHAWVGGRYSLWSAIGLPIMLHAGAEAFRELLAGAHAMDRHFVEAPLDANMPVILGLLAVWYRNFHGCQAHAVLPYLHDLRRLPDHLQQLEMESLGKSVDRQGARVDYDTGGIVWGGMGNEGQHAFFQLLHQGTTVVPLDLIVPAATGSASQDLEKRLQAHALAQGAALMLGRGDDALLAELQEQGLSREAMAASLSHKLSEGGRPSNTIVLDALEPRSLGALIALYEHKVFVQSVIWDINPFDQWGVELGKRIAGALRPLLDEEDGDRDQDPSTAGVMRRLRRTTLGD